VDAILDHDDTVSDLRRYFGVGLPAQQVPPFTGGWFERVGLGGDRGDVANRITTDDLIAVETLSVRASRRARPAARRTGRAIRGHAHPHPAGHDPGKPWGD
jgi:hypothetical protein